MDAELEGVPVSATNNYTPDTDEVRSGYRGYWRSQSIVGQVADAEFDRWLAAERAKARAEAFEEAAVIAESAWCEYPYTAWQMKDAAAAAIRSAAQEVQ